MEVLVEPLGMPGLAADINEPAANTAAVVTYAATTGKRHVLALVVVTYSGTMATTGNVKIEDVSGTKIFSADCPTIGTFVFPFAVPKKSAAANTAMIVTAAAAGASCAGKVSCTHWTTGQ